MSLQRVLAVALASLVVLVIVLVVAFTFIGLYRVSEYYARFVSMRTPRANVSEAYDDLKTGDVLLFVGGTHTLHNSMLTQTYFSHAGMVLREGELVYIAEASTAVEVMPDPRDPAMETIRTNGGATITPFLTRLKFYNGASYVMRLARPLAPGPEEALKAEAERLYREAYPYPSTAQLFLGIAGRATASRHCFQHVAHLIDTAGLTPLGRGEPLADAGFTLVCDEVCELPGRPLPGGYYYEPPVQLLYDIDARPLRAPRRVPRAPQAYKTEGMQHYGHPLTDNGDPNSFDDNYDDYDDYEQ
jgi:hypothetical protein